MGGGVAVTGSAVGVGGGVAVTGSAVGAGGGVAVTGSAIGVSDDVGVAVTGLAIGVSAGVSVAVTGSNVNVSDGVGANVTSIEVGVSDGVGVVVTVRAGDIVCVVEINSPAAMLVNTLVVDMGDSELSDDQSVVGQFVKRIEIAPGVNISEGTLGCFPLTTGVFVKS